jgi:hypothetical protein
MIMSPLKTKSFECCFSTAPMIFEKALEFSSQIASCAERGFVVGSALTGS